MGLRFLCTRKVFSFSSRLCMCVMFTRLPLTESHVCTAALLRLNVRHKQLLFPSVNVALSFSLLSS